MTNPFDYLTGDNWAVVAGFLETPWDTQDLVCLQRTCHAGAKLFASRPDLMPAEWRAMLQEVRARTGSYPQFLRRSADVYLFMQGIFGQRLYRKPWFVPPTSTTLVGGPTSLWSVEMLWKLDHKVKVSLKYFCDRNQPWSFNCTVREIEVGRGGAFCGVDDTSLRGLLDRAPRLAFGVSTEMLRDWACEYDIACLCIKKRYRQ
jgi:hypothetical protein